MRNPLVVAVIAVAAIGCGGTAASQAIPASSATQSAAVASPTTSPSASPASTAASTQKASANNGTIPQLVAALTANGVPNPDRWAREVDEYRPYPTSDPTFAKLKGELAKYNPSTDTLTKILASLSLP